MASLKKAIESAQQSIKDCPRLPALYTLLGQAHNVEDDFDYQVTLAKQACELAVDYARMLREDFEGEPATEDDEATAVLADAIVSNLSPVVARYLCQ